MWGCGLCEEGSPVSGICTLRQGEIGPGHQVLFGAAGRVSPLCWGHRLALGLVVQGQRSPAAAGCHPVLVAGSTGVSVGRMPLFPCSLDWGGMLTPGLQLFVLWCGGPCSPPASFSFCC